MTTKTSTRLAAAQRDRLLVKFTRPFEEGWVEGYILAVGPRFFVVALVRDVAWFNGFQCFRMSDVRGLQVPPKFAAFVEAALKKRGERIPKKPRVSVESIEELLVSANRAFPLVTIHREKVRPGKCRIGRILNVIGGRVSLLEINPDATWDSNSSEYKLSEITRVDFGGDYEHALHLVGGSPAS